MHRRPRAWIPTLCTNCHWPNHWTNQVMICFQNYFTNTMILFCLNVTKYVYELMADSRVWYMVIIKSVSIGPNAVQFNRSACLTNTSIKWFNIYTFRIDMLRSKWVNDSSEINIWYSPESSQVFCRTDSMCYAHQSPILNEYSNIRILEFIFIYLSIRTVQ